MAQINPNEDNESVGPMPGVSRKAVCMFSRFFRLMLITSLYIKFTKYKGSINNELLQRINDKFHVVLRTDALWVPAILSSWLWRKYDPADAQALFKTGEMTKLDAIKAIYGAIPSVGRYVGVSSDIESVLLKTLETN